MYKMLSKFHRSWILLLSCYILFVGCEEALQSSLIEKTVQPIAPGENVTTVSPVNFNWEIMNAAESYRIRVMSPSFDSAQILIFDSVLQQNIISLPLDSGVYQWKVQGLNSISVSKESEARTVIID